MRAGDNHHGHGAFDGEREVLPHENQHVWPYVIQSDFAALKGQSGKFTAVPPPAERTGRPSAVHPNWWIDDPDPAAAEGIHLGAKSVNQWREQFLGDFAARMRRCKTAASKESKANE